MGHYFHFGCLQNWLKTKSNCPNCRAEIELKELQEYDPKHQKFEIKRCWSRSILRMLTMSNKWTTVWLVMEMGLFYYLNMMDGATSTVLIGYCLYVSSMVSRDDLSELKLGMLFLALFSNVLFTLFLFTPPHPKFFVMFKSESNYS